MGKFEYVEELNIIQWSHSLISNVDNDGSGKIVDKTLRGYT